MSDSTSFQWWRGLPTWGRLSFALVAFPAWLVIVYCVLAGKNDSALAYGAFAIFAAVTVLHIILIPREPPRKIKERSLQIGDGVD